MSTGAPLIDGWPLCPLPAWSPACGYLARAGSNLKQMPSVSSA